MLVRALAYVASIYIASCHASSDETLSELYKGGGGRSSQVDLVDFEPSRPAQSVLESGTYVSIAQDVVTGTKYIQTGNSIKEAIDHALALCRIYASELDGQCTTVQVYTTRLSPTLSGDIPKEWACFASDHPITGDIDKPRAWLETGDSMMKARENVLKMCESSGGIGCSIDRCFNGGRDKIR